MLETTNKSLAAALLEFQKEAPTLPKDGVNPHFKSKYTPLDTIIETVTPLLAKHGLVWTALPSSDESGRPALHYQLVHASTGELIAGTMPLLLGKQDSQGLGSALTYSRRYALTAVLNLASDEDDDGNAASRPANNNVSRQPTAASAQQTERPATAKQRGLINARAGESGLPPSDLAHVVCTVSGTSPREFETEDQAAQWVNRQLDRLPARLVNPVLEKIAAATA